MQIPDEAVHSRRSGKNPRRPDPVHRDRMFRRYFFERHSLVYARVTPDKTIPRIENLEPHGTASGRLQVVIEDRAIRWIFSRGDFRGKRRVGVAIPTEANGLLRREERD